MECLLVLLPFILGLVALIQMLIGDEEGARRTNDAIDKGISGLGRNLFMMEVLDDRDAAGDPDRDPGWW